ncbi:MAG: hypothetical protein ACNA7E_09815, partial [Wenzhouxiangellaceae bacterium]
MTTLTTRILIVLLAWSLPGSVLAAEDPHWLAQRAASSDAVVLAQLDRTDYEYRRDFPVGGRAWFRPLQTWKSDRPLRGLLIVGEQGLHEHECYFPRLLPWEERPRFLLFLVRDEDSGAWRGHPDGCALEVLVNDANRYAARWPQPGFGGEHGRGDEVIRQSAQTMTLQGPRSRIDASDLLPHQRRELAERDFMRVEDSSLVPTRGIELGDLRQLMRPGLQDEDAQPDPQRMEELRERMLP